MRWTTCRSRSREHNRNKRPGPTSGALAVRRAGSLACSLRAGSRGIHSRLRDARTVASVCYRRPYGTEWEAVDLEWAMDRIAQRHGPRSGDADGTGRRHGHPRIPASTGAARRPLTS